MPDNDIMIEDEIERVAVIGMSARFPGADNIDEFWHNIRNGVESVIEFNDDELRAYGIPDAWLTAPNFVKSGTILNDIDKFDAAFFGYSPREATFMDPQQRLFLEVAWEALENSGYTPDSHDNSIGVFAGSGPNEYSAYLSSLFDMTNTASLMEQMIGNEKDFLSTRVSYKLNLKGPSLTVQSACSTSLLAAHLACQSLLGYQCSLALAGGTRVNLNNSKGYFYQDGTIVSPDGHCRAFDAKAHGTVVGQGVGVIVLKRLSEAIADGDHIYAVIRGCAVNNDGGVKVGYTAPSVNGQAEVIAMAHAISDTPADSISYIETHGTGTSLGDPIEIDALTQAFRGAGTSRKQFCAIGSIKPNIGHADSAAGVAGLIKTVLMLENREIPPSINFQEPNPSIDFDNSPFYVSTALSKWETGSWPRRAGVSSFGIGGTNVHVVLEETLTKKASGSSRAYQILMLSAQTAKALDTACKNLGLFIKQNHALNLPDAAFTLQVGRRVFNQRRIIICRDNNDAILKLEGSDHNGVISRDDPKPNLPVTFMFSGQGTQYAGMGADLYKNESAFREYTDKCLEILRTNHSINLREILFPEKDRAEEAQKLITRTATAQLSLFVIEYSLAKLWMSWGINPESMAGHSIGEYVAACLSGVFSLETALAIVVARGRLMQETQPGAMLAVTLPHSDIKRMIGDNLSIAAINAPRSCVVSGDFNEISDLEKRLDEQKIAYRRLHTSHAFHSKMMEPILDSFREEVSSHSLSSPHIPFVSNLTGKWITSEQATDPEYWVKHLRGTVLFSDCIKTLLEAQNRILLEVGPGNTLYSLSIQQAIKSGFKMIFSSLPRYDEKISDQEFIITTLGKLWLSGAEPDWRGYYKDETRNRVPLPAYPFDRKSFWPSKEINKENQKKDAVSVQPFFNTSPGPDIPETRGEDKTSTSGKNEVELKILSFWEEVLHINGIKTDDNFFELGGNSLIGANIIARINREFGITLTVSSIFLLPTVSQMARDINSKINPGFNTGNKDELEESLKKLGLSN